MGPLTETSETRTSIGEGLTLRPAKRLLMLLLNSLPLFHAAAVPITIAIPWISMPWRIFAAVTVLYFIPPIAARIILAAFPISQGRISPGGGAFFVWWTLANIQMLFCRLPFLEEILRLVPGLYSFWLRLWGARIGRLTYWGAGLRILDRSFLNIGDNVIFGAAVRINPHVLSHNEKGEMELLLADVIVGDRALIGGYSLLTAGTEISMDECTRAFLISPPFSRWKDGHRIHGKDAK